MKIDKRQMRLIRLRSGQRGIGGFGRGLRALEDCRSGANVSELQTY